MSYNTGRNNDKDNVSNQTTEILENISDGCFALDRNWSFTYINKAASSYLGFRPEALAGKKLWEEFPMILGSEHETHYRETMQKGEPQEFKTRGIVNHRWFNIRVCPSMNGILVYWQDITMRKLTEEAFKKNVESFREIQTLARIGSWEYDSEKRTITWSAEIYVLYERDPKLGPPSPEENAGYYSPDQYKTLMDNVTQSLRTGETISFDLDVRLPSQKPAYYHVTIHPLKNDQSRAVRLYSIVQDVTERKQAEEKLKESEEKYRNLVELTSDFIWEVDKDGVFTYVSPKIYEILGYRPEEVLGKTPFDLMPPDEAERISRKFQEYVSQKKPFNSLENINRHKDGSLIVLETSGVPFYGTKEGIRGYRGIDRDITQRKKIEEALRKSEERLRQYL